MTEPTDYIHWVHDCPPDHELRIRKLDDNQIEVTCLEYVDEPLPPPMKGQVIKWCGVHMVTVDWHWSGSEFIIPSVNVQFTAEADA